MIRGLRSLPAVLLAAALGFGLAAFAALAPGSPLVASCAGAGPHHAALVVEHGDGSVVTRCVAFDTASVTGEWLLNTSGLAWSGQTFGAFGEAVCALDGEPAHYSDCPGKDEYWAVFVARGGGGGGGVAARQRRHLDADSQRRGRGGLPLRAVCRYARFSTVAVRRVRRGPGIGDGPGATARGHQGGRPAQSHGHALASGNVDATTGPAVAATDSPAPAVGTATPGTGGSAAAPLGSPPATVRPASAVPTAPSQGSGVDFGLVAAALAGGGLAGLALLRVLAARRSP